MPDRKQPMSRGKPLERGGELKRTVPLTSRTPLQRVGSRTARAAAATTARDTGPTAKVRRLVYLRCGAVLDRRGRIVEPGWCEWPGCTAPRTDLQHRLARGVGGRGGDMATEVNCASNLLAVCRPHHNGVTSQSGDRLDLVRAMGWVLIEGQNARTVPAHTRHDPAPVLLDDAGSWTVAA